MNKQVVFTGPFKDVLPKYIEYKQALGFAYSYDYAKRFREMDNFFAKNYKIKNITLTKDMVLDFTKKRDNEANSTTCHRCSIIREFAMYLSSLGYKNIFILPNHYIPKCTTDFIPYVFSHEQIKNLFYIIDNYNFGSKYLRANKVYSTLARLLYGCGLRISEALSLKVSDLDFTNNIIHVFASKNNTSRIVCMSNSLANYIIKYIKHAKLDNNDWLFASPKGRSLSLIFCTYNV